MKRSFRWAVVGFGNQGRKHVQCLGNKCKLIVDVPETSVGKAKLLASRDDFDFVVVATPEEPKSDYISSLVDLGKSVFVEKPLPLTSRVIASIENLGSGSSLTVQTSYDHMFDQGVKQFCEWVARVSEDVSESSGWSILDIDYSFGTRELVRASNWMDFGTGPWELVAPHALDLAYAVNRFDPERFVFNFNFSSLDSPTTVSGSISGAHSLRVTTSYTSWKNSFSASFTNEWGSVVLQGLTKWGSSRLEVHRRAQPVGAPENLVRNTYSKVDGLQYVKRAHRHFENRVTTGFDNNFERDIFIWRSLEKARDALFEYSP